MGIPYKALVHETSVSTGSSDLTLAAVNGRQRASTAYGTSDNGVDNPVFFIMNRDAGEWEVVQTYLSDANTLVRPGTVIASSNANATVNFSAGTKDVTSGPPASVFEALETLGLLDLVAPGADRLLFWDHSELALKYLTLNAGLEISGTTLRMIEVWGGAASDESTTLTAGTNKLTFPMPYAFTVTGVYASVNTVSSSGAITIDINENGTSILSTKLTIDAGEKTSGTAATPAVISDVSIAANAEVGVDIDGAGTGAKGLRVFIFGYRS